MISFQCFYNIEHSFFYLKLHLKLKINPKTCNLKNLEKIPQKHLAALNSLFVVCFLLLNVLFHD